MPPADDQARSLEATRSSHAAPAAESGPSPSGRVRSGSFTALLQQIAAVEEADLGADWSRWLHPGALVGGRFEMIRELGRGGFGVVWEARDQKLGRNIAFKAVRAGTRSHLREERLLREAEAAARLSHPNIVTIHDVGQAEQAPYLVLELLEGETLADRLARGPLPLREAIHVAAEVAKGVAHAHARGVVHRDLKPANVVVCEDGRVKVLDFGMAQAFGQRHDEGGTPAYMAPEQWAGAPEDERSDVYALGVMIFEMATGALPFPPDDRGKAVRSPTRAPALEVAEAPALGELVARMLEKDPTRRPRECGEVLEVLSEVEHALSGVASTPVARVRSRRRSSRLVLAGVVAGVLLGVATTVFALWSRAPAPGDGTGRTLVAVADFANETNDPDLDGLSGLLITSLEQSRSFRVLTRGRMIDLIREMGRSDASHIDESVAREVGRKAGVHTLLLASIQKLGDTYAAELRALDPRKDEYLFTVREQASRKGDLLPLIDRMSERTRLALRESDAEVKASEVRVGEAVTGNLEAYRHYFRGKELAAKGALPEAVGEYRRALEIEPSFALAAVEIAWIGYFSGDVPRAAARDLLRRASERGFRAPAKEAGLARILTAFFDGRFIASGAEIRALVAAFPEDRDVAVLAAEVSAWCGDFEQALPYFDRALKLAPEWDLLRLDQVGTLAWFGRSQEALQRADQALKVRATPAARMALGLARYVAGDVDGGIAALRASGEGSAFVRIYLAQGLAARGGVDEAIACLDTRESISDAGRAWIYAYAGRLRDGLAALRAAARRPGADAVWYGQVTAWYLAAAGALEDARHAAGEDQFVTVLDGITLAEIGDRPRMQALLAELDPKLSYTRFLRAVAELSTGDRKAALAELRALDRGFGGRAVSFLPYYHGVAAAEAGQDEEAVEALRRFDGPVLYGSDGYLSPWLAARARYLLARSLDRLGRRDEARAILDLQLARWRHADETLPLLAEMRSLRAKLGDAP